MESPHVTTPAGSDNNNNSQRESTMEEGYERLKISLTALLIKELTKGLPQFTRELLNLYLLLDIKQEPVQTMNQAHRQTLVCVNHRKAPSES